MSYKRYIDYLPGGPFGAFRAHVGVFAGVVNHTMTCKLKTHASSNKIAFHRVPGSLSNLQENSECVGTLHSKHYLICPDFRINVYTSFRGGTPVNWFTAAPGTQSVWPSPSGAACRFADGSTRAPGLYLRRVLIPIQFTSSHDCDDVPLAASSQKKRGFLELYETPTEVRNY